MKAKKKPMQVYFIESEKQFIDDMSNKLGISRSDYVRQQIKNQITKEAKKK